MVNRSYRFVRTTLLLALLLFSAAALKAQSFPPQNLGAVVNSEYAEVNPVTSITGDTLFFSRLNHKENHFGLDSQDIWMTTKKADGGWNDPERLPNSVNIARYNALYGVLADGKTFLIGGIFDKDGKFWLRRGFSFIKKGEDGQWGKPVRIKMPWYSWKDEGDLTTATITPDGNYIFMAFASRWASKRMKMYVSYKKKEGEYSKPIRLKGPFNNFYHTEAPYFAPYDGRLYFSAKQNKTDNDAGALYSVEPVMKRDDSVKMSQKDSANFVAKSMVEWKNLYKLSDTVNSSLWDSYFSPQPSGTFAYFASLRESFGRSDIYRVMLVEERPWTQVKGYLVNARTGQLMPKDKRIEVRINGEHSDSIVMIDATFFALLPLNQKYVFTAHLPHYTSDSAVVDVTGAKLHSEHEVRLTLKSVPYVKLSGTLVNSLSQTAIPTKNNPQLLIDGNPSSDVKFDAARSSYTVELPFGRKYTFAVKANEYEPIPTEIDLTQYNEYAELTQNVPAKPKLDNLVTLKGRFIDTKTGQPLEPTIEAKMKVNKMLSDGFIYNPKDATYTLKLVPGTDYDLVPSVMNYYNKLEVVDLSKAKPRDVVIRDFYVTPLEVGQSVDIENIFFETGKSKLKEESYRSLNALVEFFQEYPNVKVEIGGHTDNVGSAAVNKQLSKERAKSVALYIIEQGISKDRFQAKGFGSDKPKASNKTKEGRARNRRVDFTIMEI